MTPNPSPATAKPPQFPTHTHPRVWLITNSTTPIGLSTARHVLAHGDSVVLGFGEGDVGGKDGRREGRGDEFWEFWDEVRGREEWRGRCRRVGLDGRSLIGTVEELAATPRTQTLVREQFETNFFGPVNVIKAALPQMRKKQSGHILILTGISGHLGTPGLGMYCASGWALEGFCDSLAYEIAPFDIKLTIIQPTMEIGILTNKIVSAPSLPQYEREVNPAPLFKGIIGGLLSRIQQPQQDGHNKSILASDRITSLYPKLPGEMKASLIAETINAVTAIGGHDNPPARHIVGHEGVSSVKEKLKTVSEELEDFVEVSCAVDIDHDVDAPEGANGSAAE
ncbi:hypothetical protein ACLMJK_001631 [Lecanora helva]